MKSVFIAGSTGYLSTRLSKSLLERGYEIRALARSGSEKKVPAGIRYLNVPDIKSF